MTPKVSFVVPCYKLAHLLPECVNSILSQSYKNVEVVVMDDCSPDNTPEVAKSFTDPRVRYVRNEPNLGHLKNYNKGIGLCTGEYIWLISADDKLRGDHAVDRYVKVAEANPKVGFVFCPAMGLKDGQDRGVEKWTHNGDADFVMGGREYLTRLVERNWVAAPAGMVRKECYEKLGAFPLDLPYAGDWYLWCLFSLHYDVAYIAEPLVHYRLHEASMTNVLTQRNRVADNLAVLWRTQLMASELGCREIVERCTSALALMYSYCLTANRFQLENYSMTMEEFEESLRKYPQLPEEKPKLKAKVYASFGDGCYRHGDASEALHYYALAVERDFWMPKVWAKSLLLRTGKLGRIFRHSMAGEDSSAQIKNSDPKAHGVGSASAH